MNNTEGPWDWSLAENRTGCELGLIKVTRKKYFELHGVNSSSTFNEYDANAPVDSSYSW